jgi:hypothetical protein
LLLGASAAHRNRAWGVALMFAQAIAFPVAFFIGIAPSWFCVVGTLGAVPFLLTAPGFARVDRGATRVLAALAIAGGAAGAIAWKELAYSIFESFPAVAPSIYPQHGFIVAAVAALGVAGAFRHRRLVEEEEERAEGATAGAQRRVASPTRIASLDEDLALTEHETEERAEEILGRRTRG